MLSVGRSVRFKRTDGTWSTGIIKEIQDLYLIVEWKSNNGFIGTKKVHKLDAVPFSESGYINNIANTLNHLVNAFVLIIIIVISYNIIRVI